MRRNRPLSSTEKPSKTSTYYHALYLANRFNLQDVCHQHVFWAHDFLRFLCHSFPDFFTTYPSHICSTCKIIIKQEGACMKLPPLLIEMICPLTYKSCCFLAPRTSLKSFRCPEATTIHYTTTLLSTFGERMRRLPNWDRTMTKCLDVDPISVVWHHWLLQIRNFRNWFTATVGWPWFSTDLRVKTIGMII